MKPISATARLQFHKDFTLDHATSLVPYFAKLGVSHLYASPLLTARAGSTHGYDIVNHNEINPELGGEEALRRLVAALRERDMGLILDIVPNHMGVGGNDNAWWLDVLEWGRASPYAEYFDIDWDPPDPTLRGSMLAPFLGSSYGECLERRRARAEVRRERRAPFRVGTTRTVPDRAARLLRRAAAPWRPAREPCSPVRANSARAAAPRSARPPPRRARGTAAAHLQAGRSARRCAPTAPATPEGQERLHRLLERQHYRLAWWRAAADEINWRRFFDVNGLAGVRQEVPEVFEATHRTVFRLYTEGLIDGVRIDHVDGLAYPREYCRKLRRRLETLAAERPPDLRTRAGHHLGREDPRPARAPAQDWMTDGTTGYDFMNDAAAVLHDPAGETPLTAALGHRLPAAPPISRSKRRPRAARSCAKASVANCSPPRPRCTGSPGAT